MAEALTGHARVEAWVDPTDPGAMRVATWSGLRREGVMRGGVSVEGVPTDRVVYARLVDDLPPHEPEGFRALLNSFLPRKRAISQMLVRDPDGRVLLCRLTYKQDWDLPGRRGRGRRVAAGRRRPRGRGGARPRRSPPGRCCSPTGCRRGAAGTTRSAWSSTAAPTTRRSSTRWCGRSARSATPRSARPSEVRERCADFTARRVEAALASLAGGGTPYTESLSRRAAPDALGSSRTSRRRRAGRRPTGSVGALSSWQ